MLRVAAVALAAHADRACAMRAAGDLDGAAAEVAAAEALVGLAREGASYPARPKARLGPEGRGCLARCLAEYERARGRNAPAAWEAVLDAFGPGYVYETARAQWRLAESLVGGRPPRGRRHGLAVGAPRPPPGCAPPRSPRRLTTWPAAPASTWVPPGARAAPPDRSPP